MRVSRRGNQPSPMFCNRPAAVFIGRTSFDFEFHLVKEALNKSCERDWGDLGRGQEGEDAV